MIIVIFLLALAAFAAFGLATEQHHQKRFGKRCDRTRARRLRVLAWTCLIVALPLALLSAGAVFGPILWCAALMGSAAVVFLGLNLLPARRHAHGHRHRHGLY